MAEPRADLSDAERDVLKALWEHGPCPVRSLLDVFAGQGRKWAYTTLQTLLTRLTAKGYARSLKNGPTLDYGAALTRDEFLQERLTVLADDVCGGTTSPLVLALVEGGRLSAAEIDRLRAMLDRLDGENAAPQKGGR